MTAAVQFDREMQILRELDEEKARFAARHQIEEEKATYFAERLEIVTLAEVLQWLPPHIVAEFDCVGGPHQWMPRITSRGNTYEWCRICTRMRRTSWLDTHPDQRIVDPWLRG